MDFVNFEICRTCTSEANDDVALCSIYDTPATYPTQTIEDLLLCTIPGLQIEDMDNLPKHICTQCLDKLIKIEEFQIMCLQSQNRLHEKFDSYTLPKEETKFLPDDLGFEVISTESTNALQEVEAIFMSPIAEDIENNSDIESLAQENNQIEENVISELLENNEGCLSPNASREIVKNLERFDGPEEIIYIKKDRKYERDSEESLISNETKSKLQCIECGRKFSRPKNLRKHLLQYHSFSYPSDDEANFDSTTRDNENDERKEPKREGEANLESTAKHNENDGSKEPKREGEESQLSVTENISNEELSITEKTAEIKKRKKHVCPFCNKEFRDKTKMTQHVNVHTGEKPYICSVCGKSAARYAALWYHMKKVHNMKYSTQREIQGVKKKPKKNYGPRPFLYFCEICNKGFRDKRHLSEHMTKHTGEKPHTCPLCGESYARYFSLMRHVKRFHNLIYSKNMKENRVILEDCKPDQEEEEPQLCTECGKSFKNSSSLQYHLANSHLKVETKLECPYCPKQCGSTRELYSHKRTHFKIDSFICETCGAGFSSHNILRKHSIIHREVKPHKCQFCEMRFSALGNLRRHEMTHTGEKPYKCKYCSKTFLQSTTLMDHLKRHLGENVYRCELCPERFRLQREMREHFVTHKNDDEATRLSNLKALQEDEEKLNATLAVQDCIEGVEPKRKVKNTSMSNSRERAKNSEHICEYCSKGFMTLNYLILHKQRHFNEDGSEIGQNYGKDLECPDCPKKFVCKAKLDHHRISHENIKPHECDVCGATFKLISNLTTHKKIHEDVKPYKCTFCEMRFVSLHNAKRHENIHTGEKPFQCKFCGKTFGQASGVTQHLVTHLGKNVFSCEMCPQRFPLARDARAHLTSHKYDDEATRLSNLKALQEEEAKIKSLCDSQTK